jgi:LPXTG-motif cell wall-anchored protein
VAGARASGGEDADGGALTAREERAAEATSSFARFGKANIAGIEVMVPVLILLLAGVASLGGGLFVALRRREAGMDAP